MPEQQKYTCNLDLLGLLINLKMEIHRLRDITNFINKNTKVIIKSLEQIKPVIKKIEEKQDCEFCLCKSR